MSGEAFGSSPSTGETQSLRERIEKQRQQISKAMSIIEACRMGSDSMLAPLCGAEEADFTDALAVTYELLDEVAGELEIIGSVDQGAS